MDTCFTFVLVRYTFVLVRYTAITKCHKPDDFNNIFIVSLFWRPEVQDRGQKDHALSDESTGKELFQASLLASGSSLACGNITPTFI